MMYIIRECPLFMGCECWKLGNGTNFNATTMRAGEKNVYTGVSIFSPSSDVEPSVRVCPVVIGHFQLSHVHATTSLNLVRPYTCNLNTKWTLIQFPSNYQTPLRLYPMALFTEKLRY